MGTLDNWEDLEGKSKVSLCLALSDRSRSDEQNQIIEDTVNRVLNIAKDLDDDGKVEFFSYDSGISYLETLTPTPGKVAVDKLMIGREIGPTNYAKGFAAVRNFYHLFPAHQNAGIFKPFRKPNPSEVAASSTPVFAVFLTTGEPVSSREAELMLNEVSSVPIFWKFLSIGPRPVEFLQHLDDLTDRFTNNADYKHLGQDPSVLDEATLRSYVLDEYPVWLEEARDKGLVTS